MEIEDLVGLVALIWLIGSLLLMARSIRSGRELAEELARRHPATYEALGRPRPGYLENVRRTQFARFVGRREIKNLADEPLSVQFEAYRKSEARLILSILASGVIVALIGLVLRYAT